MCCTRPSKHPELESELGSSNLAANAKVDAEATTNAKAGQRQQLAKKKLLLGILQEFTG